MITMTVVKSVFFFIVALAVLIAIHEFGHYWVAKRLGVKVLRFSIGFGKPLFTRRGGPDNTEYVLAAVPLGGYVRMLDEREGEVPEHEVGRAFNRQPLFKRAAIVVAGPLFNFVLAILAYWLIYVVGIVGIKPIVGNVTPASMAQQAGFQKGDVIVSVGDKQTVTWDTAVMVLLEKAMNHEQVVVKVNDASRQEQQRLLDLRTAESKLNRGNLLDVIGMQPARPSIPPVIGFLEAGGAAERAGLKTGDRVISADGVPIRDWDSWVEYVRARPGGTLQVELERQGRPVSLILHPSPVSGGEKQIGHIGASVQLPENISAELQAVMRYPVGEALWESLKKTWDMSVLTLRMVGKMIVGDVSVSNISGPISIAQYAGYTASAGMVSFLAFLAVVSISLGVLNLMPVPVLDGGHLFFYLIEFVKGSPVSERMQLLGQRIGIALLLMLMVIAFYNDIARLFGLGK